MTTQPRRRWRVRKTVELDYEVRENSLGRLQVRLVRPDARGGTYTLTPAELGKQGYTVTPVPAPEDYKYYKLPATDTRNGAFFRFHRSATDASAWVEVWSDIQKAWVQSGYQLRDVFLFDAIPATERPDAPSQRLPEKYPDPFLHD